MIETRLLHYFLAVAREQNITRAAEALHVTQSTLSKQMMDLERQLGKQLLIRGNRSVTLTEEGRAFIQGQTDLFVEKVTHIIRQMGREDFLQMISLVKAAFQAAFQYDREHPEQSPRGPRHTGEGRERD